MDEKTAKKLAKIIAEDLFTDGAGEKAKRLVMEYEGQHLKSGGWSEGPVRGKITQYLMNLHIGFTPKE